MVPVRRVNCTGMDIWPGYGTNRLFIKGNQTPDTRILGGGGDAVFFGSDAGNLDGIAEPVKVSSCLSVTLTDTTTNRGHTYRNGNFSHFSGTAGHRHGPRLLRDDQGGGVWRYVHVRQ